MVGKLVEEGAAPILIEQMREFEPLPNVVMPGCQPHCSLALLSRMVRHDPAARRDLLARLPHFCSLLGTDQPDFLQVGHPPPCLHAVLAAGIAKFCRTCVEICSAITVF